MSFSNPVEQSVQQATGSMLITQDKNVHRRLTKSKLAIAIMAISSSLAYAEEAQKDGATLLDQVTVSATRTEKQVKDVARSVSVITEEQIENQLSNSIQDVVRYEPGVNVEGSGRLGAKGFNIRGLSGNRVKVMVDGISLSSTYDSGSTFLRPVQDYVDIDSIRAIEIVKGPGSTLYGSDALAGTVSFISKKPADYLSKEGNDSYASLKAGYSGKDSSFTETITLANRNNSLETMFLYTRRDYKETESHSGAKVQGPDRGVAESLDGDLNNFLVEARYHINSDHIVGTKLEYLDQGSKSDLEATLDPQNHSDDTRNRKHVNLYHEWKADLRAFDTADTKFSWQNTKTNQITYTYDSQSLGDREKEYFYEQGGYQLSVQLNKAFTRSNIDHLFTYGFSWVKEDLENDNKTTKLDTGEVLPPDELHQPGRYSPLASKNSWGIYAQDEMALPDDKTTVTAGIRYDNYKLSPETDSEFQQQLEDNKSDDFTASLGISHKRNENLTVYALFSQGFRSPTLDEAYYAYENIFSERNGVKFGYAFLANPDLKPEKSNSFEIGAKFEGYAGTFEISAYRNDYKDFIEEVAISGTEYVYGATQSQNVADAYIEGVELRGELWLDEAFNAPLGLSLKAAIAYANGFNEDEEKPLASVAPLSGVFGLHYDTPQGNYGGALQWTISKGKSQSDIEDDSRHEVPGYGLVDLTGYYKPIDNFTVRAGLFNLTDKKYWIWEDVRTLSKNSSGGQTGVTKSGLDRFSQPGRNFSISAKYEF